MMPDHWGVDDFRFDAEAPGEVFDQVHVVADDLAGVPEGERRVGRLHADAELAHLLDLLDGDRFGGNTRCQGCHRAGDKCSTGYLRQHATRHQVLEHDLRLPWFGSFGGSDSAESAVLSLDAAPIPIATLGIARDR